MQAIRDTDTLNAALKKLKDEGKRIAFVPTMGALHAGHVSLVELAKRQADAIIVSIFVNPTQFGPNEDFSRYPRQEDQDIRLLENVGTAIAWLPTVEAIYPNPKPKPLIPAPEALANCLCGASRPGHFDGVVTVVMRLFDLVQPDVAVFGEKDWQQLAILRAATQHYHPAIQIIGAPIAREADGLAMSSRNAYLTLEERVLAAGLHRTLKKIRRELHTDTLPAIALADGINQLEMNGFKVDYLELRTPDTLEPALHAPARLFVAARLGNTRLIDNIPL